MWGQTDLVSHEKVKLLGLSFDLAHPTYSELIFVLINVPQIFIVIIALTWAGVSTPELPEVCQSLAPLLHLLVAVVVLPGLLGEVYLFIYYFFYYLFFITWAKWANMVARVLLHTSSDLVSLRW